MSYALSAALQAGVFQTLSADAVLTGLVGSDIYDALPSGTPPPLYVSLGQETALDASDKTGRGAVHRFTIRVTSDAPGFTTAKSVAGAVCDALLDQSIPLTRGRLVSMNFDRASATRTDSGNARQIDLRFRARVEDS